MDSNFSLFLGHRQVNPATFSALPAPEQQALEDDWLRCKSYLSGVRNFNPDVLAESQQAISELRNYDRFLAERANPPKSEFEIRREVAQESAMRRSGNLQEENPWDEVSRVRREQFGGNEPA